MFASLWSIFREEVDFKTSTGPFSDAYFELWRGHEKDADASAVLCGEVELRTQTKFDV